MESNNTTDVNALIESFSTSIQQKPDLSYKWLSALAFILLAFGTAYNTLAIRIHEAASEERLTALEEEDGLVEENHVILLELQEKLLRK